MYLRNIKFYVVETKPFLASVCLLQGNSDPFIVFKESRWPRVCHWLTVCNSPGLGMGSWAPPNAETASILLPAVVSAAQCSGWRSSELQGWRQKVSYAPLQTAQGEADTLVSSGKQVGEKRSKVSRQRAGVLLRSYDPRRFSKEL